MGFIGKQRTFTFEQTNNASRATIFPLLCPVREVEWIDGWEYEMIHSKSGFAEQDCVFTTPYSDKINAVWQITQYDPEKFILQFVKFIPNETVIKINICLEAISDNLSKSIITYQYTGLNEEQNQLIESSMETSFEESMIYWESAINHYLKTEKKLLRS